MVATGAGESAAPLAHRVRVSRAATTSSHTGSAPTTALRTSLEASPASICSIVRMVALPSRSLGSTNQPRAVTAAARSAGSLSRRRCGRGGARPGALRDWA